MRGYLQERSDSWSPSQPGSPLPWQLFTVHRAPREREIWESLSFGKFLGLKGSLPPPSQLLPLFSFLCPSSLPPPPSLHRFLYAGSLNLSHTRLPCQHDMKRVSSCPLHMRSLRLRKECCLPGPRIRPSSAGTHILSPFLSLVLGPAAF